MKDVSEEDWKIVLHRIQGMPTHIKLAIGKYGSLSRKEMIEHVKARDEIGKRILEMQMNYLKFFKKEMESVVHG